MPGGDVHSPAVSEPNLHDAIDALDRADAVVDRLHKMCCEPDRSPRMLAIKDGMAAIRTDLETGREDAAALEDVLGRLSEVGGLLGYLQVACCAPPRMPLYAETLERLTAAQLSINASMGRAH